MSIVETVFEEASALRRVASLPMSHVSIELGHLYMEDFASGQDRLTELLTRVAPFAATVREAYARALPHKTPRISTCFLVDDYFAPFGSPREVVPMLLRAADAAGLTIDYLARESACDRADKTPIASIVVDHLVQDPEPGTDGTRPVVQDSGWLCNGVRSPTVTVNEAMKPVVPWRPPAENGANRHSIFVDVELWSDRGDSRQYSCPFLASVWQLLRLGALRFHGDAAVDPRSLDGPLPDSWPALPPVTKLAAHPMPFSAYRTFSILDSRFLSVEQAVRTILGQYAVERDVTEQIATRAAGERLTLPPAIVDRVDYTFVSEPWTRA